MPSTERVLEKLHETESQENENAINSRDKWYVCRSSLRSKTRKRAFKGSWKERKYPDYQRREGVPQVRYSRDKNAKAGFAVHPGGHGQD